MKEIGILFKQDMIRAILDGRKTMTRRIIKPQPDDSGLHNHTLLPMAVGSNLQGWWGTSEAGETKRFNCRYGELGDHLYVKETFIKGNRMTPDGYFETDEKGNYVPAIWFKATDSDLVWHDDNDCPCETVPWKSPLFLRKEDARIWLHNTGVSVERLQDISEEDAIAEGVESFRPVPGDGVAQTMYRLYGPKNAWTTDPRQSFRTLIQSIHGPEVWNNNPWVWKIKFEVLSTNGKP